MRKSLQFRLVRALVIIVGAVLMLGTLATVIVSDWLEDSVLMEITQREGDAIARAMLAGEDVALPRTSSLQMFVAENAQDPTVPAAIRAAPAGHYDEVGWRGGTYHVYRRPLNERWLYVAYDITAIERREDVFGLLLWVNVALALLLTGAAGIIAARLTIAPIAQLAHCVQNLPAQTQGQRLATECDTDETIIIASALDRHLERIERLVERERDFTTDASHELRTPLAVILTTAELLETRTADHPALRAQIERILRAARQMSELADALLLLAREDQGDETTRVDEVARTVAADAAFTPEAATRLQFDLDDELAVTAPRVAVATVVQNLVGNALRHAPTGPVVLRLRGRCLEITDHGPGMPQPIRERALERAFHAGATAGSGFGLYITRRLCERFGWHIRLQSDENRGTRVAITF
ncbi:HAMP domain-containing sensor histidine kinase [Salinisphaera sp. P385]|uniref:histidine kinase n=1 Tax=Spectribacter acetivorans TaxID=3075603 RepID=A0ABU3BAV2_9GAMM|nr:HAMP domain-containing sensor histidine kinase [Salinisphaera sp. P385]MDT0619599.1 HAMP domain-containing sensor histidine kinase [Salinisphaera sp. P385]